MHERALQANCAQWLNLQRDLWFTHPANEGVRSPITGALLKRAGMTSGCPDLLICINGRFLAIELKAAKGRATPHQIRCAQDIQAAGGRYALCRSLEDVIEAVEGARG